MPAFVLNPWSLLDHDAILALHEEQVESRRWTKLRQREMDLFFAERCGDPNVSAQKYMARQTLLERPVKGGGAGAPVRAKSAFGRTCLTARTVWK
jgi:hypothetical protein